jgi:hypothetical protein
MNENKSDKTLAGQRVAHREDAMPFTFDGRVLSVRQDYENNEPVFTPRAYQVDWGNADDNGTDGSQCYDRGDLIAMTDDNAYEYVVYSTKNGSPTRGVNFWNNDHGWTSFDSATRYSRAEMEILSLPIIFGRNDARWIRVDFKEGIGAIPVLESP